MANLMSHHGSIFIFNLVCTFGYHDWIIDLALKYSTQLSHPTQAPHLVEMFDILSRGPLHLPVEDLFGALDMPRLDAMCCNGHRNNPVLCTLKDLLSSHFVPTLPDGNNTPAAAYPPNWDRATVLLQHSLNKGHCLYMGQAEPEFTLVELLKPPQYHLIDAVIDRTPVDQLKWVHGEKDYVDHFFSYQTLLDNDDGTLPVRVLHRLLIMGLDEYPDVYLEKYAKYKPLFEPFLHVRTHERAPVDIILEHYYEPDGYYRSMITRFISPERLRGLNLAALYLIYRRRLDKDVVKLIHLKNLRNEIDY